MNSGTSSFLNASRWVAAFFVVLYHVYRVSIGDYVGHLSLILRGVHFFSDFGHMAVIVFFVISGFLVGGRSILRSQDGAFDLLDYFVHRFSRIYTVFIPALIVGYILDSLGMRFCNSSGIYIHPDHFFSKPLGNNITEHLTFEIFLGNVIQLQTIVVSVLGSNGPLWSLANEWWYYVFFGFCMVVYRSRRLLARVITGGAMVAMVVLLPLTISLWFVMWGIGAGVAVLDRYWAGWPFFLGATAAVACLIAIRWLAARNAGAGVATDFILDLSVALGYSVALVCAKNLKKRMKFESIHRILASFSYTVYLVHFPAMVFVAAFLKEFFDIEFSRQPTTDVIIYIGALVTILYGYAWLFAYLTEAHTDAFRSRLRLEILGLRRFRHQRIS
jgi:peptidoglycan/LPS O-acetylase OafA/YrhL